jgi:transposase InsO family protein
MPWDETTRMSQRVRFISDLESCQFTMTELCAQYGISRKTGYKWAERFVASGPGGLEDRPHTAKSFPHQVSGEKAEQIVSLRRRFPSWGPRKLRAWLERHHPESSWPAASTIGDLLKRQGLVESRPRQRRPLPPRTPQVEAEKPNAVWSLDFKGQFRLGDSCLCYPLTATDGFSRYLLGCRGLQRPTGEEAKRVIESLFREYGLPQAILTDNGSPFASPRALARLSRLSVWWIKLGIRPVLIQPGHPEQNGRHERMHRTLKAETARPPALNGADQQARFEQFQRIYNEQRPHEALGQIAPAEVYEPSPRPYPSQPQPCEYPGHFEVRSVGDKGEIWWRGQPLFVSHSLQGERIGLQEVADGHWKVYLSSVQIASFDEQERRIYG